MTDIVSAGQRSKNMAAIRSHDTKPEVYFRKLLFAKGFRYRKNYKNIEGHPDIYLAKYKTAIFINGCFWHRHENCKYAYNPKSNMEFWNRKFENNIQRDKVVRTKLSEQNIKCLVIWECTVKRMKKDPETAQKVLDMTIHFFLSNQLYLSI